MKSVRIYSVPSIPLMNSKWISLTFYTFSPRQFLGMVIGLAGIFGAVTSGLSIGIMLFCILIMAFAFIPFGFLPPEKQIINFLNYKFKQKNVKTTKSNILGYGNKTMIKQKTKKVQTTTSIEEIAIPSLDNPFTITLMTSNKGEFLPVSVYFLYDGKEIDIADVTINQSGEVSFTAIIPKYDIIHIKLVTKNGKIVYDRECEV